MFNSVHRLRVHGARRRMSASSSRVGELVLRFLPAELRRPLFILPMALLEFVVLMIGMEPGYAATGGAEVYSDLAVGSNTWRQITFMMLGSMGVLLLFQPRPKQAMCGSSPRAIGPSVRMIA